MCMDVNAYRMSAQPQNLGVTGLGCTHMPAYMCIHFVVYKNKRMLTRPILCVGPFYMLRVG